MVSRADWRGRSRARELSPSLARHQAAECGILSAFAVGSLPHNGAAPRQTAPAAASYDCRIIVIGLCNQRLMSAQATRPGEWKMLPDHACHAHEHRAARANFAT